jgi:hypothetical protein
LQAGLGHGRHASGGDGFRRSTDAIGKGHPADLIAFLELHADFGAGDLAIDFSHFDADLVLGADFGLEDLRGRFVHDERDDLSLKLIHTGEAEVVREAWTGRRIGCREVLGGEKAALPEGGVGFEFGELDGFCGGNRIDQSDRNDSPNQKS